MPEHAQILCGCALTKVEPRLFLEFTSRAGELILPVPHNTFGRRPRANILPRPVRASRMDEKYLGQRLPSAKEKDTCTDSTD